MREIKFRGQTGTTEGKKWVYGNYYKVKSFFNDKEGHFIGMIRNNYLNDFSIEENTLGQYTELKDKNGKEIYEGDIVYIIPEDEKGAIMWDKETARYIVGFCGIITDFDNWYGRDLEVIGNIYDNPELLVEKE